MEMRRLERLVRSTVLALPFKATNMMTRFEIEGRRRLLEAVERSQSTGRGLITISNHQSLFDDPMLPFQLLGTPLMHVESKIWWSTPCQANFHPSGTRPSDRAVRYFSDVSNMVFFERPAKKGGIVRLFDEYAPTLAKRVTPADLARFESRAAAEGLDLEEWLQTFVTPGDREHLAAMNQIGMIEALARVSTGNWLHFFPEGTRSRNLSLRKPKKGVGKVVYHAKDVDILPVCFYGMHDVLPVDKTLLRPGKRVVISVGEPVPASAFDGLRALPPTPTTYQTVVEAAWSHVTALRPATLVKYLGPARAEELMRAEAPAAHRPAGEGVGHPVPARGVPSGTSDRAPLHS